MQTQLLLARSAIKAFLYLVAALLLVFAGVLLSRRPGTIPFFSIVTVTFAFLLAGKGIRVLVTGNDEAREERLSWALKEYYVIVVLTAFSFYSLCSYFFLDGFPFHDNASFYSLFHDNLQSLNYFGTPAWWFPDNQFGFPGYFYSILGNMNCLSPVFVILAAIFWALGRLGFHITNIMPLYIWYFGAIVPFVFSLSVWIFARRVLTWTPAIIFVAILCAFSPGVLLNFGDLGLLEAAAYGLFLAAAYLRFIDSPDRKNFLGFLLALLVFAVTINYALIIWNVLFLVTLFIVSLFPRASRTSIMRAFRSVPVRKAVLAALLIMVCLAAPFLTLSQRGDIVRTTTYAQAEDRYLHMDNSPGNPLEALLSSTPGIGFMGKNTGKGPYVNYPLVVGSGYMGYIYLGLLAVPLFIVGLLYGRADWRLRILWLAAVFFGVVLLANYSPLFLLVLNLGTLLSKNSHFNDVLYRSGGFVILIVGAGMGLECAFRNFTALKRLNLVLILSLLTSFALYVLLARNNPVIMGLLLGVTALLGLSYLMIISWIRRGIPEAYRSAIISTLLLLVLCDVSTMAHLHARQVIKPNFTRAGTLVNFDRLNPDNVGLSLRPPNGQADTTLSMMSLIDLQERGIPIDELPRYALFRKIHRVKDVTVDDVRKAVQGASLAFAESSAEVPSVKDGRTDGPGRIVDNGARVFLDGRDYTSLRLRTMADDTAVLLIRDGYHRYWKAKVNGEEAKIYRALHNFKAVTVPKGESIIELTFRPPWIMGAIILAYLSIICVAWSWVMRVMSERFIGARQASL